MYDKYLKTLSEHIARRFPDVELLEAFILFDPSTIPVELELHGSHGQDELRVLTDHYSRHGIVDSEAAKAELRVFNSVIAANAELKQLPCRGLTTRLLNTPELEAMFPNLNKLAAISLLLPMSMVDCERGFSALSRIKTDLRNPLSSKTINNLMTIAVEGPAPDE